MHFRVYNLHHVSLLQILGTVWGHNLNTSAVSCEVCFYEGSVVMCGLGFIFQSFMKTFKIQNGLMTQNTVFQHVKNIFLLSQKKLIFFTELNLTICLWFQSLLETFFFKSSKNGTFLAKFSRVKMAWKFFLNFPQFFRFKNLCKITS